MSICQFIVTLYFIALYMTSSLIAPPKSRLVRAKPNYTNVTDILHCDTL